MPPLARSRTSRTDSTTATAALLRALASLGPRLHEPLAAADPGALYAMVCATLRECRLDAHIAEIDATDTLRIAATSIAPSTQDAIERLIGASFIGCAIAREGPYAEALAASVASRGSGGSDAVVVAQVMDLLAAIGPRLTTEQRERLAQGAAAEVALLAPIVGRDQARGVLALWGPRAHLGREDAPAVVALAAQVGLAAENARLCRGEALLERQSYSALRVILRLAEIATAPAGAAGGVGEAPVAPVASSLLARIVEALLGLEAVSYVHALLVDEEAGRVQPVAIGDVSPAVAATWREEIETFRLGDAPHALPALAALRAGHVLRQDLTQQPPLLAPCTVRALGVRAAITAPVRAEERLVGLLTLGRIHPPDPAGQSMFAPFDEELLLGAARLAGQSLTRAWLAAELTTTEAARLAAEAATRQRDAFLSMASHELRTPLTSIKTLLHLLSHRAPFVPEEAEPPALEVVTAGARGSRVVSSAELLGRLVRQVDRLTRLVDDLLETSRIETGHLELHRERADLVALVSQVVEEQRQINPARTIAWRAPAGPIWVEVDTDRIAQVVANYLTNAVKYSASEQPVLVRLRVRNGRARVAVRDHGPGVPAGERELIWQRFHRVPGTEVLSGSGIGLGIGLHISKTFVERHGGSVGIEQPRGDGAIFWFSLPLA